MLGHTFSSIIHIYAETILYEPVTRIIGHSVVTRLSRPSLHYSNTAAGDIEVIANIVGDSIIRAFEDHPRDRCMNTHHICTWKE